MVCLLLQIVGVAIFMKGFFPVKSAISGHATFNDYEAEPTNINQTETADYTFNRLIIVLIDALRADFVFSEEAKERMPHLSYLLSSSNALGFRAKSHPPTVTLPRIKVSFVTEHISRKMYMHVSISDFINYLYISLSKCNAYGISFMTLIT